jgi:hypothetical protein
MEKYEEAVVVTDEVTNEVTEQKDNKLEESYKQLIEVAIKTLIDSNQDRLEAHNKVILSDGRVGVINISIDIVDGKAEVESGK